MSNNINLYNARKTKNDEYYSYYEDIEKELTNYKQFLENKTIYLPCDNPEKSNFYKFFKNNFKDFKIKKVLCTYYRADGSNSYLTTYDEKGEMVEELDNCGDFLDIKNLKYYEEADVVITNPPFSLFRDFIDLLFSINKDFILVSMILHMSYTCTFNRFKAGLIRFGYNNNFRFYNENKERIKITESRWITTFKIKKEYKKLECNKTYSGNEEYFKKYDNSDTVNVDRIKDFTVDCDKEMGVPLTILDYYNSDTLLIPAYFSKNKKSFVTFFKIEKYSRPEIDGIRKFSRVYIRKKEE